MNILCFTNDELKKVLGKLEKDGCKWMSGNSLVNHHIRGLSVPTIILVNGEFVQYDNEIDDYKGYITARNFLFANDDLNTEKSGEATGERLINKAEFDKAISQVAIETLEDTKLQGGSSLMAALLGATFAKKMQIILFEEGNE